MKKLERVCRRLLRLIQQAGLIPQSVAKGFERRRWQAVLNEREVERLDRIRNPSKYRGK